MIHIDIRTGDYHCDRCGAEMKSSAPDADAATFLRTHADCAQRPIMIERAPSNV